MIIKKARQFQGELYLPGDKSISHRAAILAAISEQTVNIRNFNQGKDCLSTLDCLLQLGIPVKIQNSRITIQGKGLRGFHNPEQPLNAGNSGTTMRLLSGLLAGQQFSSIITGDESLNKRPMKRIIHPLIRMGAQIYSTPEYTAPLQIVGTDLSGISHKLQVASAQVKSCIILAGLLASTKTNIIEPVQTRNHTELMLNLTVEKSSEGNTILVEPGTVPHFVKTYNIPGDISNAAYLIAGALICKDGTALLRNVGINPTRAGVLDVLESMGAEFTIRNSSCLMGEDIADIQIHQSRLRGISIGGDIIPNVIDEIPILAVIGSVAEGSFSVRDAAELRVKECDRITAIVRNLRNMGTAIEEHDDGFTIYGGNKLKGTDIKTYGDHRIAMAFTIAGLVAEGETVIDNPGAATISYPGFWRVIENFTNKQVANDR